MDIKLLSGALGAEISGIDLKDTSSENFKKIDKVFRVRQTRSRYKKIRLDKIEYYLAYLEAPTLTEKSYKLFYITFTERITCPIVR